MVDCLAQAYSINRITSLTMASLSSSLLQNSLRQRNFFLIFFFFLFFLMVNFTETSRYCSEEAKLRLCVATSRSASISVR